MLNVVHTLWTWPATHGFINGALGGAAVDFAAFRTWKTWQDASTYNWGTASFRWVQGGIVGLITAAGLAALFGS